LDILDALEANEPDNRPAALHSQRRNRELLLAARRLRPDARAGRESLLDEIGLRIDDDLAFQTVRSANASHLGPVVPALVNP
jgi:hypothetical protein